MFLFIFESIGTSELILIGIIALVVFGPRKLPQMAKTIGKTMADFKRTTNDFKSTWEKEVDFEEEGKILRETFRDEEGEKTISRNKISEIRSASAPEIKEIDEAEFNKFLIKEPQEVKAPDSDIKEKKVEIVQEESNKRDWL